MKNPCEASKEFRGAGDCCHKIPAKNKEPMVRTSSGDVPLNEFLVGVGSNSEVDPHAYFSMIGILKNMQLGE